MKFPQVCLSMIVRDESAVVLRALSSVSNLVSAIAVVDTGSVDGTLQIMRAFASKAGIAFASRVSAWRDDFAYHRNESLELVRSLILGDCFVMYLDADEFLVEVPRDLEVHLEQHDVVSGWLLQGDFMHLKHMFVRTNLCPRWEGMLHEQLSFDVAPRSPETVEDLVAAYGSDGVRRREGASRVARDLEALENDQIEFGGVHRRAYLKAMTLEAIEDFQGALTAFATAARLSTTSDERYLSLWGEARCGHHLKDLHASALRYRALVEENQERAEGWVGLAQIAFFRRQFADAYECSLRASGCAPPLHTILYDRAAYSWLPHEIMGHASCQIGRNLRDSLECFRVALSKSTSNSDAHARLTLSAKELGGG